MKQLRSLPTGSASDAKSKLKDQSLMFLVDTSIISRQTTSNIVMENGFDDSDVEQLMDVAVQSSGTERPHSSASSYSSETAESTRSSSISSNRSNSSLPATNTKKRKLSHEDLSDAKTQQIFDILCDRVSASSTSSPVQNFLMGHASTLAKFSPRLLVETKTKIAQVVFEAELKHIDETSAARHKTYSVSASNNFAMNLDEHNAPSQYSSDRSIACSRVASNNFEVGHRRTIDETYELTFSPSSPSCNYLTQISQEDIIEEVYEDDED